MFRKRHTTHQERQPLDNETCELPSIKAIDRLDELTTAAWMIGIRAISGTEPFPGYITTLPRDNNGRIVTIEKQFQRHVIATEVSQPSGFWILNSYRYKAVNSVGNTVLIETLPIKLGEICTVQEYTSDSSGKPDRTRPVGEPIPRLPISSLQCAAAIESLQELIATSIYPQAIHELGSLSVRHDISLPPLT